MLSSLSKATRLHDGSRLKPRHSDPTTPSTTRSRLHLIFNISAGLRRMSLQTLLVNESLYFSWWNQNYILLHETDTKSSYVPANGPLNLQFVIPVLSSQLLGSLPKFFNLLNTNFTDLIIIMTFLIFLLKKRFVPHLLIFSYDSDKNVISNR